MYKFLLYRTSELIKTARSRTTGRSKNKHRLLLLALFFFFCLPKTTTAQITLSEKKITLDQVFHKIARQTGYYFVYNVQMVRKAMPVTINVKNEPLAKVLDLCLSGQPFSYKIDQKTIIISRKEEDNSQQKSTTDTLNIRGRVVDPSRHPLPGATLTINSNKGQTFIITNENGFFDIGLVPRNAAIEVSYIGYLSRSIHPRADLGDIVLTEKNSQLDETVVIGYGSESKRFSVGSTSTLSAKDIENQPVSNPLAALEGQVPGLTVTQSSGVPGASMALQIRGQNSLQSSLNTFKPYDQPLFIIDGVPFAPQNANSNMLTNLNTKFTYTGGLDMSSGLSPFNSLNPRDIESISILKDADATSIYGTQGANGVIIITTKKGKAGETKLSANLYTGYNSATKSVSFLNTAQYLQLRSEAFKVDQNTPQTYNAPDLLLFDQTKYTDWEKVIFGNTSRQTDAHLSLSGGVDKMNYLVSAGYTNSTYNFPGNFADNRFTLLTKFHTSSSNNRFTADFTNSYSYDKNNAGPFGGNAKVINPPNLPDLLDKTGNLAWDYKGASLGQYQLYSYLKQTALFEAFNLNADMQLSYKFTSDFKFSTNIGYSRFSVSERGTNPLAAQNPLYASGSASFSNNTPQTFVIEPQFDYNLTSGKGIFKATLGGSFKRNSSKSNSEYGDGYSSDALLNSIGAAGSVQATDSYTIYKYTAAFLRLNYIYDSKYIINLTGRREASSVFGPNHQFGNFGSAGIGWIFSEEAGIHDALPFFSFGKLSANYGTSGSDGIAPYQYQAFWAPSTSGGNSFQGIKPVFPLNVYNPDYTWAKKKSLNIALNLGLFNNRLLIIADVYQNRESNQLTTAILPTQSGFNSVLKNLPATVQNRGLELTLNSTNLKSDRFTWTSSFNLSFNRNKLLAFEDLENSPYYLIYTIGAPTTQVIGYKYKGVNPQSGLFEYYDRNGQATSSPIPDVSKKGGDYLKIADTAPRFSGGIGNNFSYRNINLSFFFNFSKQTATNYLYTIYGSYAPGSGVYNVPAAALDYWKKPGDRTSLQRLTTGYGDAFTASTAFPTSSGAYSDDTYLRLKTVALSYTFPDKFLKKLHMTNCQVYVNAQNLLTITNWKVGDPEQFGNYLAFPLQRTIVFGLNFNL
jgi:TonB-linked SusC/RagA family outer membrane protein